MFDLTKIRRESIRWYLLLTLLNAQPVGCYEEILLSTLGAIHPDVSALEIRQHLEYLKARNLVAVEKESNGRWFAKLSRYGIDVAEYTIDCEPGIARPVKTWG